MGDFWEIRKISMKATGEKKTCKLFRKRDLCQRKHLVDYKKTLETEIAKSPSQERKDYKGELICNVEVEADKKDNQAIGRELVEHELRILSKLDHPNIISVNETFEDRNNIYFIIDDFNGGSLYDKIIYEGFLQETPTATLSAYMISTIKYLQKNGVILRNLRPEHMFFEDKDSLDFKLADLTLAVEVEDYEEGVKDEVFDEF